MTIRIQNVTSLRKFIILFTLSFFRFFVDRILYDSAINTYTDKAERKLYHRNSKSGRIRIIYKANISFEFNPAF